MLELGGVELLAEKRKKGPLVVAGGGAAFNPDPMKQFIDVFAIGEGEDVIVEIMNVLAKTKDRNVQLKEMSKIDSHRPHNQWKKLSTVKQTVPDAEPNQQDCEGSKR